MILLWDNLITDAILTSSSENLSKPIDNLKDTNLAKYFEMTSGSGNMVIDLLSAQQITDFMIPSTNITSGFTTLKLEANTTNSWASPAYSVDLELYNNTYIGAKDINQSYRYWRLVVNDTNITTVSLGYCYIGDRLQLPGIDPSISLSYNTQTSTSFSVSQQVYSDTGVDYFSSEFEFPLITEYPVVIDGKQIATREDILEFWYFNKGATPIIIVIWDNNRDRFPPVFGLITQNQLEFSTDSTQAHYSMNLNFVETK